MAMKDHYSRTACEEKADVALYIKVTTFTLGLLLHWGQKQGEGLRGGKGRLVWPTAACVTKF